MVKILKIQMFMWILLIINQSLIFLFSLTWKKKKRENHLNSLDFLDFYLLNFNVEVFYRKIQDKEHLMKFYRKKYWKIKSNLNSHIYSFVK